MSAEESSKIIQQQQQQQQQDLQRDYSAVLPIGSGQLSKIVQQWLEDDMPSFDVGGYVVGTSEKEAVLWLKSPGIFAGKPFVDAIFGDQLQCTIEWNNDTAIEGTYLNGSSSNKIKIATIKGPVNKLLQGERTALNVLSRCSGVATAARKSVDTAKSLNPNWNGWIAGTRKTTPGFRIVEKYGLLVGGAATHRLDLSQMVMLKDNHIWAYNNNITAAVKAAKSATGFSQKIEVECQSLQQAIEAATAGADIIMLDNYNNDTHRLNVEATTLKQQFPNVLIEASGGITTETIGNYLLDSIDIISQGNLTQGYSCLDYSLKISL